MPALLTIGESARFVVKITPSGYAETNQDAIPNNIAVQTTPWEIAKTLKIVLAQAQILEGSPVGLSVTLTSGNITGTLPVSIQLTDPERFNAPSTVNIVAGNAAKTFSIYRK